MNGRMQYLLAAVLILGCGIAAASNDQSWNFNVYLDDRPIGYHRFELSHEQDRAIVTSEAAFDVKFLFISAYRYRHQNREVWRDQCLAVIDSWTDNNGDQYYVNGRRGENGFRVETAEGTNIQPDCVNTFAYWDADFLDNERLLNAQTGELVPVDVEQLGTATVHVDGEAVPARHYRVVTDEMSIDLWYSLQEQDWLALQTNTRKGAVLRYQRTLEVPK